MNPRILATAAIALAGAAPALAAVEAYTIDPRHTFPSFEVNHLGYSLQRGRFNRTSGKITVDTEARKGTIDVTIDATSVSTGVDKLEEHVRGEDFLNTSRFPTINFKSSNLSFEGDKLKSASGELTMAGVTRPVTLTAELFNCGAHPVNKKPMCGGEFVARIRRSEWGIKYAIPALADEMTLRINVEAVRD
ncbi:MAG: YceI family protein [Usitatibacter sp.]